MKRFLVPLAAVCFLFLLFTGHGSAGEKEAPKTTVVFAVANNASARDEKTGTFKHDFENRVVSVLALQYVGSPAKTVTGYVTPTNFDKATLSDPQDLATVDGALALVQLAEGINVKHDLDGNTIGENANALFSCLLEYAQGHPDEDVRIYLITDRELLHNGSELRPELDSLLATGRVSLQVIQIPEKSSAVSAPSSDDASSFPTDMDTDFSTSDNNPNIAKSKNDVKDYLIKTYSLQEKDGSPSRTVSVDHVERLVLAATYDADVSPGVQVYYTPLDDGSADGKSGGRNPEPGGVPGAETETAQTGADSGGTADGVPGNAEGNGAETLLTPEDMKNGVSVSTLNETLVILPLPEKGTYRLSLGLDDAAVKTVYYGAQVYPPITTGRISADPGTHVRKSDIHVTAEWICDEALARPEDFSCTLQVISMDNTENATSHEMSYSPENNDWEKTFPLDRIGEYMLVAHWENRKDPNWKSDGDDTAAATVQVQNLSPVPKEDFQKKCRIIGVGGDTSTDLVQSISLQGLFTDADNDAIRQIEVTQKNPGDEQGGSAGTEEKSASDAAITSQVSGDQLNTYADRDCDYSLWVRAVDAAGGTSAYVKLAISYRQFVPVYQLSGEEENYYVGHSYAFSLKPTEDTRQTLQSAGLWDAWLKSARASMQCGMNSIFFRAEEGVAADSEGAFTFAPFALGAGKAAYTAAFRVFINPGNAGGVKIVRESGDDGSLIAMESQNSPPIYAASWGTVYRKAIGGFLTPYPKKQEIDLNLKDAFRDDTDEGLALIVTVEGGTARMIRWENNADSREKALSEWSLSADRPTAEWPYSFGDPQRPLRIIFSQAGDYTVAIDARDSAGNTLDSPIVIQVKIVDEYVRSLYLCGGALAALLIAFGILLMIHELRRPKFTGCYLRVTSGNAREANTVRLDFLGKKGVTAAQMLVWAQSPPATGGSAAVKRVLFVPAGKRNNEAVVKAERLPRGIHIAYHGNGPREGILSIDGYPDLAYEFYARR